MSVVEAVAQSILWIVAALWIGGFTLSVAFSLVRLARVAEDLLQLLKDQQ